MQYPSIAQIESELNYYIQQADQVRRMEGESINFRNICYKINELQQARDNAMRMSSNQQYYQPMNQRPSIPDGYGYGSPGSAMYNANSMYNSRPVLGGGYTYASSGANSGNNKYASKATLYNAPKVTAEYPVGNANEVINARVNTENKSMPQEGHELPITTHLFLEARKVEKNGLYRYEIYGDITCMPKLSNEDIHICKDEFSSMNNMRKYSLVKSLQYFACTNTTKYHSIKPELLPEDKKSKDSTLAILVNTLSQNVDVVSRPVMSYFTKILNTFLKGGSRLDKSMTDIRTDLVDLKALIDQQVVKVQSLYSRVTEGIKTDILNNVSYKVTDDNLVELTHKVPVLFVADSEIMGNLLDLLKSNKTCCVTNESNPLLYGVIHKYFSKITDKPYVMLYHMDSESKTYKIKVMLDIYNNYVLERYNVTNFCAEV